VPLQITPMLHLMSQTRGTRKFPNGSLWLLAGMLGIACVVPDIAVAQQKLAPPRSATAPVPPSKDKAKTKKPAPTDRKVTADEPVDPTKLPTGYIVPPEPPDWLTTTDEWIFEPFEGADAKESKRKLDNAKLKYSELLSKGEFANEADKRVVTDMIEWKLSQLTRKENRDQVWKKQNEIFQDINGKTGVLKNSKKDVRILLLQTVADKANRAVERLRRSGAAKASR